MHRKLYLLVIAVMIAFTANSQNWYEEMINGANYNQVRQSFDNYLTQQGIPATKSVKPFERWAHDMSERAGSNGILEGSTNPYLEYKRIMSQKTSSVKSVSYPSWTSLGPNVVPSGTPANGNGRLNFIVFHPDSVDVIYVGAPVGGLWKSTDGGLTFNIMSDTLAVLGCSDLAINPNNPDIMYLATGDRDARNSYSVGILKSIDGGRTWNTTGLDWVIQDLKTVGRIAINPQNENTLIAATSDSIYKTTDAGMTWDRIIGGNYTDVHYKPGDSNVVYVSGSVLRVSNDAGETFGASKLTGNIQRIEMAVTLDDPNYVYAIAANGSNFGLEAVWRSTNSGQTFTNVFNNGGAANGNNLLGLDINGTSSGGQGWYDLAIAASPLDKNNVVIGGINVWRSTNGGSSWSPISHWTGNGATYLHADQHDLVFKPSSNTIFSANDGGIYYTTDNGAIWTDLTNTLQITQSYRLCLSQNTSGLVMAGNQDTGTIRREGSGSFSNVNGGDGFECFIDFTDDNINYASIQFGLIRRTTGGGLFPPQSEIAGNGINGINESGAFETPYVLDPFQNNVLHVGYNSFWSTSNTGSSWQKRNDNSLPFSGKINQMNIAPWNIDVLMVSKGNDLYLTGNSGLTFSNVTGGWASNERITNIQFSPFFTSGSFTAYVTISGYNPLSKVYKTTDGGSTWQNISAGLPNVPANCIIIDPSTPAAAEHIYVGTDLGVFYKNSTMSEFEPYSEGLPNTRVEEMEIQQNDGTIVACTYGRGIWQVPLYSTVVGFDEEEIAKTQNIELSIYPNPFDGELELSYELKKEGPVEIEIYDLQGRVVYSFLVESQPSGLHDMIIGKEVSVLDKGMYLVKFRSGQEEITQKIVKN